MADGLFPEILSLWRSSHTDELQNIWNVVLKHQKYSFRARKFSAGSCVRAVRTCFPLIFCLFLFAWAAARLTPLPAPLEVFHYLLSEACLDSQQMVPGSPVDHSSLMVEVLRQQVTKMDLRSFSGAPFFVGFRNFSFPIIYHADSGPAPNEKVMAVYKLINHLPQLHKIQSW